MVTGATDVDIRVDDITDLAGLAEVGKLFDSIWRSPDTEVPLHVLRAVSHTGGMVLGAYHEGSMVGGAFGFRCATPEPVLHSHIVGVAPAWHRRGVGTALKQHQRAWCLRRGISAITWTFDPLVRRNAMFNIARLGAVAVEYLPDFYGAMDDVYNVGLPSDRLLVRWELTGHRPPPDPEGVPVLDVGADGGPALLAEPRAAAMRLRVPAEQPRDAGLRQSWWSALREVLAPAIAGGHRLTGVTDDGWYLLTPPDEDS